MNYCNFSLSLVLFLQLAVIAAQSPTVSVQPTPVSTTDASPPTKSPTVSSVQPTPVSTTDASPPTQAPTTNLTAVLDTSNAPTTQAPTPSDTLIALQPTVSPSAAGTPYDDGNNAFLFRRVKLKDREAILQKKKCGFISSQPIDRQQRICTHARFQIRAKKLGLAPASVACPTACAPFCVPEYTRNKFLRRAAIIKGETTGTFRTCKWLQNQSPEEIEEICSKTVEFEGSIFGQARDVCTTICDTCGSIDLKVII